MLFTPTAPPTRSSHLQTLSPSEGFVDDASDSSDTCDGEPDLRETEIDILGNDLFPRESLVRHPASDLELITLTRAGDATAFGELSSRHRRAALNFAQSVTNQFDAEDMVQEAFTRLFDTISQGGGPRLSFRAYLITTIRNVASAWGRSNKESASEFVELHLEERTPDEDPQALHAEQSLLRCALGSLPQRWRDVLWMSEVECRPVSEIAELLETTPGAVSQLTFRAREGLREAYIEAHLNRNTVSSSECEWFHKHAGAFVRETASPQVTKRAQTHLKICAPCCASLHEARTVSTRLVLLLPPLLVTLAQSATGTSLLAASTTQGVSSGSPAVTVGTAGTTGTASTTGAAGAAGAVGTVGTLSTASTVGTATTATLSLGAKIAVAASIATVVGGSGVAALVIASDRGDTGDAGTTVSQPHSTPSSTPSALPPLTPGSSTGAASMPSPQSSDSESAASSDPDDPTSIPGTVLDQEPSGHPTETSESMGQSEPNSPSKKSPALPEPNPTPTQSEKPSQPDPKPITPTEPAEPSEPTEPAGPAPISMTGWRSYTQDSALHIEMTLTAEPGRVVRALVEGVERARVTVSAQGVAVIAVPTETSDPGSITLKYL